MQKSSIKESFTKSRMGDFKLIPINSSNNTRQQRINNSTYRSVLFSWTFRTLQLSSSCSPRRREKEESWTMRVQLKRTNLMSFLCLNTSDRIMFPVVQSDRSDQQQVAYSEIFVGSDSHGLGSLGNCWKSSWTWTWTLPQTRLTFKRDTHFAAGLVTGPRVYHVVHDRVLVLVEAQFLLPRAYHFPAGDVVSHRLNSAQGSILEAVSSTRRTWLARRRNGTTNGPCRPRFFPGSLSLPLALSPLLLFCSPRRAC